MTDALRIAMWSGPRNISTAMMRAFGNRPDTAVYDEPFYAAYLSESGIDHPMRGEVLAAGEADWRKVVDALFAPLPQGRTVHYQKHMTHHMLSGIGRDWMDRVASAFLIRRPHNVLASYVKKREAATLEDLGFMQQVDLFDMVCDRKGEAPPVVDARDVLENPEGTLRALCARLEIPFSEKMLSWPKGLRESDGVWAHHWYQTVAASTGFARPGPDVETLPPHLRRIADAAMPAYEKLRAYRVVAS